MKNQLILFVLLFTNTSLWAQEISGVTVDQNDIPLPGAHVELNHPWGTNVKTTISDDNGQFILKNISTGGYKLKITFLGYQAYEQEVNFKSVPIDLGAIQLQEATTDLDEIVVKEKTITATQQGDTTSYNANAFKTLADASAEDLVEKMPGVVVQDGKIQAEGEDVKEVLVDGRPFFGNDPNAALKNLPAEVIDKIQVFDQKSDQANFTGFDDGETTKTINIVTKTNMRAGQFGKIYAGYGLEDKYKLGGNFSIFNGDQRISIIGQSNNINIQNFSSEDLLGVVNSSGRRRRGRGRRGGRGGGSVNDFLVQQQGGIAQTHAIGINYSDKWGKKVDVSASYFVNNSDTESIEDLTQTYFDNNVVSEVYNEDNNSNTKNTNHRVNGRIEIKLDSANSLMIRPRLSFQQNDGRSFTFGQTTLNRAVLNRTNNEYDADLSAFNFNNSFLYRHRFAKRGRTISLNLSTTYNEKAGEQFLNSTDEFLSGITDIDTLNQFANIDADGWSLGSNLSYTEPISDNGQLMFSYRNNFKRDKADKETLDFSASTQSFDELNSGLSNFFENQYNTHEARIGYNFRKDKIRVVTRLSYQSAQLENDQTFPVENRIKQSFNNILPFAMFRYSISRQNNFTMMYRTSNTAPTIEQLQNVVDNSNPLQLSVGNPTLKQSYTHRVFARYRNTNTKTSRVFFALVSANFANNYIANSTYLAESDDPIFTNLDVASGAQITRPVNLNGYLNLRSFITYGIPIYKIKSNLNINLSGSYTKTPGLINELENTTKNSTLGIGIVLSSNISDKIDFTISSQSNFSEVNNALQANANNKYQIQNSSIKLGWVFWKGLVYRTRLQHQLYAGLTDSFNENYWLWNMSIGKKLFKNQLGEISISIFDLLNQNRSISREVTEIYIEDSFTNVLQRYVMLNFTYNFRNFNTGKKATAKPNDRNRERRFF